MKTFELNDSQAVEHVNSVNITNKELQLIGDRITNRIGQIIEQSKRNIAAFVNSEVSITYWRIGKDIA